MRITSNGTPATTKVYDDQGNDISRQVVAVSWLCDGHMKTARVTLEMRPDLVEIDVEGKYQDG